MFVSACQLSSAILYYEINICNANMNEENKYLSYSCHLMDRFSLYRLSRDSRTVFRVTTRSVTNRSVQSQMKASLPRSLKFWILVKATDQLCLWSCVGKIVSFSWCGSYGKASKYVNGSKHHTTSLIINIIHWLLLCCFYAWHKFHSFIHRNICHIYVFQRTKVGMQACFHTHCL